MIRHTLRRLSVLLPGAFIGLSVATTALAADCATVFEQCAICHGKGGASTESSIPIIGGYSTKYILESFKNFRKKIRSCAEVKVQSGPKKGNKSDMCKVVADLSDADAEAVARYIADQKFVRARQPFDAAKAQRSGA